MRTLTPAFVRALTTEFPFLGEIPEFGAPAHFQDHLYDRPTSDPVLVEQRFEVARLTAETHWTAYKPDRPQFNPANGLNGWWEIGPNGEITPGVPIYRGGRRFVVSAEQVLTQTNTRYVLVRLNKPWELTWKLYKHADEALTSIDAALADEARALHAELDSF